MTASPPAPSQVLSDKAQAIVDHFTPLIDRMLANKGKSPTDIGAQSFSEVPEAEWQVIVAIFMRRGYRPEKVPLRAGIVSIYLRYRPKRP